MVDLGLPTISISDSHAKNCHRLPVLTVLLLSTLKAFAVLLEIYKTYSLHFQNDDYILEQNTGP